MSEDADIVELDESKGMEGGDVTSSLTATSQSVYTPDFIEKALSCIPNAREYYTNKKLKKLAAKEIASMKKKSELSKIELNHAKAEAAKAIDTYRREADQCAIEAKTKMVRGNKVGAMEKMRQKKVSEADAATYEQKIVNIDQMLRGITRFKTDKIMKIDLKAAVRHMSKLASGVDLDDAENTSDAMKEAQDEFLDIGKAMSQIMNHESAETMEMSSTMDEDALEAELEEMMKSDNFSSVNLTEETTHTGGGGFPASLRTARIAPTQRVNGVTYNAVESGSFDPRAPTRTAVRLPMHQSVMRTTEQAPQREAVLVDVNGTNGTKMLATTAT